jgi:hypothetical protein
MRTIIAFIASLILAVSIQAQTDNYLSGTVRLVPDDDFLPDADWSTLFHDWQQTSMDRKTGIMKDFIVAPDGKVIISNRSSYSVYILDPSGKLLKTFGKKGGKPGEFLYRQDFRGILNNKYLVFSDHQGRINFFDMEGNFVKMITIDFMPLDIYPVNSGKLIVKGHVPMKTYARKVLASLDFTTEKYDILYSFNESYDNSDRIVIKGTEGESYSVSSSHGGKWITAFTSSGKVVSGMSRSQEIKVFTPDRDSFVESEFRIDVNPIPITQEDKDSYYENFKETLKKNGLDTVYAEKIKSDDYFPDHMPYFYNMLTDENSNIMFFMYNNENKDHLFKAYSLSGKYLGKSEFVIDGYELLFQTNPVYISGDHLYAVALKDGAEDPLRIIKCRLVSE